MTGDGNILDSNKVHGNRIGVAIRSEKDANARITLTKNLIWDNGKDIKRCESRWFMCTRSAFRRQLYLEYLRLEHEGFVGSRGGGVVISEPSKLQKTCTQPNQQDCNAQPNQGILKF